MSKDISLIDILHKFENKSQRIKALDLSHNTRLDWSLNLFSNLYQDLFNFYHEDGTITKISNYLENHVQDENEIKKWLVNLLTLNTFCGNYSELMTYCWLEAIGCTFKTQVTLSEDEVLNKHGCCIDGILTTCKKQICFDVKAFGLQFDMIEQLKRKIQAYFPDKYISIDGIVDFDYTTYQKYMSILYQKNTKQTDTSIITKLKKDGFVKLDDIDISIYIREKTGVDSSITEINAYRFASENKHYVLKNSSQFTVNKPFILMCSFSEYNNRYFSHFNDDTFLGIALRALARGVFLDLGKSNKPASKYANNLYRELTISEVVRYLSGILFLNVSKESGWLYLNPNAKHKLRKYDIEQAFGFNIPSASMGLDEFEYDNY